MIIDYVDAVSIFLSSVFTTYVTTAKQPQLIALASALPNVRLNGGNPHANY